MRVVFFGTAPFGVPTLEALRAATRHELAAVVTGLDKPRGRGLATVPTPVGLWAHAAGIATVLKPERLRATDFVSELERLAADAYVVVAFRILPDTVFTIPRYAFNLHASLLPAYRGAAPIQRAIMAGETRTGVTTFLLQQTVDTGGILGQRALDIDPEENAGQLSERLARAGADLVIETLDLLESGKARPQPQDDMQASPAPKLVPDDQLLDFSQPARTLVNRVRALAPQPGAMASCGSMTIKILALRQAGLCAPGDRPGEVVIADPKAGLIVAAGDGRIAVLQVQPSGKRIQSGAEFVRGYRVRLGDQFTTPRHFQGSNHS